jgi:Domain of unknown function (DUF4156)
MLLPENICSIMHLDCLSLIAERRCFHSTRRYLRSKESCMSPKSVLLVVLVSFTVGACTWVKPTDQGEMVRVLPADDVSTCKKVGTTTPALLDKVAGINRSKDKVQKELETLARNSAAKMGGDTVVAVSDVEDGQQDYGVYRCVGAQ